MCCLNVVSSRLLRRRNSGCVYSDIHGFNQAEIREKLLAFSGGSVELLKQDSGIAVLTINNPSRMNALSGKDTLTVDIRFASVDLALKGMIHNHNQSTLLPSLLLCLKRALPSSQAV